MIYGLGFEGHFSLEVFFNILNCSLFILNKIDIEAKTKQVSEIMKKFDLQKCMFIDDENENLYLASRNLYKTLYTDTDHMRPYDLVKYGALMITEKSVSSIVDRYKA